MITTKNNTLFVEYKRVIIAGLVLGFFILILVFSYSRLRGIWSGIPLTVSTPAQGESIDRELIDITGSAPKAVSLTINGDIVYVGESGEFRYPYPVHLGYNEIVIVAEDKFGNISQENLEINGIIK